MTQKRANLLLATVAATWGTSYIFMKLGLESISPLTLLLLRFSIAFLVIATLFIRKVVPVGKGVLQYSAVLGALLFGTLVFVQLGVRHASASVAGFLTSTSVIMVPLLQAVIKRRLPGLWTLASLGIVCAGMLLMTAGERLTFDFGALYCLLGAFLYAVQIIATKVFVEKSNALQLGVYQLGFGALFSLAAVLMFDTIAVPATITGWAAVLGLAILCSAYCYVVQPVAQKYTTPEAAGFLFALEPVSTALLALVFLHENIGLQGYSGAALILCGVILANRKETRKPLEDLTSVANVAPQQRSG